MTDAQAGDDQPRINRRRALRAAGAAAIGVTLSELVAGETTVSAQTTGAPLLLGEDNEATATTRLTTRNPGGTEPAPEHGLDIQADANYGLAVSGNVWGVYSLGLLGGSFVGSNDHGAPIELYPRIGSGPPPEGTHFSGELVVDENGRLFLCDRDADLDTGTPGRWVQVSHRGQQFLTAPVRVVSTQQSGGKLSAGSTRVVDLSGVVPPEATGVFGNITLAFTETDKGFITLWPTGVARPNTSQISWGEPTAYVSNSFTSKVGTDRQVSVYASQPTHFFFDVYGYIV